MKYDATVPRKAVKQQPGKQRDRILVVDDDADARDLISAVLTQAGYAVELAQDGFEAVRMVSQARPDLVLTDLQMPGMHGVDLIQHVRSIHGEVPIILATGMETRDLCTSADLYGAFACLVKPINLDELLWNIDCALACRGTAADRSAVAING